MKSLFNSKYSEPSVSLGLFILRLALGGLMLAHGFDKLTHFDKYLGMFKDPFGINNTISFGLLVFAEFFCALLVLIGLLTRLACIPLIFAMGVALFSAHKGHVFSDGEMAALYFCGYIALLFTGPGKYSLDKAIGK
jgi:putative oxidoreductase